MKAFYITGPKQSALGDILVPTPGPEDVLLRTRIVGMCGSDLNTFRGSNPMVTYPRIPGHEIAATIEEVGSQVPSDFRPGMDVTLSPYTSCGTCASCRRLRPNACQFNQTLGVQRDGAMTSYFVAHWSKLYASHGLGLRDLNLVELSLVEPLSVGFHAAARGRVRPSDAVLVLGCGTVGLGAIAASAFAGAKVIACDLDDHKLALAQEAGASLTIHSGRQPVLEAARELTGGLGPDVVIEAIGLPETFQMAVDVVAFTGRVVYVGYAKQPVSYETKLFVQKELDILGSRNALDEFPTVIAMLQQGTFPVAKVISMTTNLAGAGPALTAWSENPQAFSKILIEM
ncbi:MAG: zinc-binding alcohol dehydrogenase family protein [Bryobacteraceae bacterium]|nr:zinc-binding alcohol dehydrogenase family protein [Bryobacteraceae bacterium]